VTQSGRNYATVLEDWRSAIVVELAGRRQGCDAFHLGESAAKLAPRIVVENSSHDEAGDLAPVAVRVIRVIRGILAGGAR
jgi:hypothetical protein